MISKENIINKYPQYFKDCQEFSIDNGWMDLVELFIETASMNIKDFKIIQIKEKFGCLNIYYDAKTTDQGYFYLNGIDITILNMSKNICEKCGTNKNIGKTNGWVKHLCKKCAFKRFEKINYNGNFKEYWIPNKSIVEQRKEKLSKL